MSRQVPLGRNNVINAIEKKPMYILQAHPLFIDGGEGMRMDPYISSKITKFKQTDIVVMYVQCAYIINNINTVQHNPTRIDELFLCDKSFSSSVVGRSWPYHVFSFFIVNIGYYTYLGMNHFNRFPSVNSLFILYKLSPKANIRSDYRSSFSNVSVSFK